MKLDDVTSEISNVDINTNEITNISSDVNDILREIEKLK